MGFKLSEMWENRHLRFQKGKEKIVHSVKAKYTRQANHICSELSREQ